MIGTLALAFAPASFLLLLLLLFHFPSRGKGSLADHGGISHLPAMFEAVAALTFIAANATPSLSWCGSQELSSNKAFLAQKGEQQRLGSL